MSTIVKSLEDAIGYVEQKIGELKSTLEAAKEVSTESPDDFVCMCNRCIARRESTDYEVVPVSIDLLNLSESTVNALKRYGVKETTNILESASLLFEDVANEMAILEILTYAYRIRKNAVLRYVEIMDDNTNNMLGDVLDLKMHHLSNFVLDRPDLCTPDILNHQNKVGNTPLMICIFSGMMDCFEKMLSCEFIDVNKINKSGDTAFTFALMKKNHEMAFQLISRMDSKSLFIPNRLGKYPIHMAIFFELPEIANLIFDKMFHSEELKEEAKSFLSSPSRNTLLKNCCQFRNSEIAIRLLNLQNETIAENEDRVITFFYCIQNNLKEVAELILSNEKNPEKWIRGEGKIEENNVIAAFAKPIFLDLVIPMAEMIDSSNPHLIFHFCHEMIMASSLHQDLILDWMVSHYHIPTYFVMDPDLNTIYSYLAINGKTEHFKTLYGREIGSSPDLLMMNKSESNPLLYSIQHKNHEIAIFILENVKLENQSMLDLMMQYQKMAIKNKSPKSLLMIFEKKIRYFEKMKRQKENDELQKILTEMGEIIDTPKKVIKPVVISPPPVSTKNKRMEKANEVSDMEMAMILTKQNIPKPPKQESPIANKADVKKPVKETPVSPPKKVKPEKKKENPKSANIALKTVKEVITPKKEEDIPRPVIERSNMKENFILDCEKTDTNYLNQLAYVILDSLGIYE